ncbi:MAG: MBOAT family O-acyltransferase [Frankiaceae bacterium]
MIFPTIEFAAFFLVVFTLSWLLMPHQRVWKPFILAASFFFYGYADVRFVLLLAVSMLLNQAGALAVHRAGTQRLRKALMLTTVIGNLGLLGWFKYYGFFADSVDAALRSVGLGAPLPFLRIALPVGISFFTFMAMSYVIDVYRREIRPTSLINFAVFEAFFPHLVAGPIVRASEFLPQLEGPRNPRNIPATRAFFLIMGGLFKKVVLAELLATHIVDPVFNSPGAHSAAEMLVAIYAYAVQIFCDFSAYSEMAIGFALLLGFRFPDNFNRPYTATSLRDFWHRWHMTLSRWLRDYLYIPLGGNRRGPRRTYANLMATMLLGGLWHGAAWTFVIWGGIHGTGLCVEHWWDERKSTWRRRRAAAPYLTPYPARGAGVAADPPPYPPPSDNVRVLSDGGGSGGSGPQPAPGRAAPRPHPAAAARLDKPGLSGQAPSRVGARSGPAPGTAAVQDVSVVPADQPSLVGTWACRIITFNIVCLAFMFFRSPDLSSAFSALGVLFTGWGQPSPLITPTVVLAIAVGIGVQYLPTRFWDRLQLRFSLIRPAVQGLVLGLGIVVFHALVPHTGIAPFIYFRF